MNGETPTPAEMAAGLTTKQKAVLIAMPENGYRSAKEVGSRGSTMRSLWDRWHGDYGTGRPYSLVHRDVSDYPLGYIWELSREGLAVRAHLLAQVPA